MGTAARVLTDQDFLNAHPDEQRAYLSSVDKDFAGASRADQDAYLEHVRGGVPKPTPTTGSFQTSKGSPVLNAETLRLNKPAETPSWMEPAKTYLRAGALGLASGFSGMPESTHPLNDWWESVKQQGEEAQKHPITSALKAGALGPAVPLYEIGKGLAGSAEEMGRGEMESIGVLPSEPGAGPERTAHGGGKLIGQLLQLGAAKSPAETTREGIVQRMTTPAVPPGLSERATVNLTEPLVRRGAEKIFRGASPTGTNIGFRESLATAAPDLAEIERAAPLGKSGAKGGILKPDLRVRQTVENINNKLDDIWQRERQPQIDRQGDAHTLTKEQLLEGMTPEQKSAIENKLDVKIPDNINVRDADGLLKKVNARLRKTEGMTPEGQALAKELSPVLEKLDQMKDRLHDAIGNTLESRGEPGIREFNRRYGALSEVRDAFRTRMNPNETARVLDDIRVHGGLHGPGIFERLHIKASPGRLVQKGLQDLSSSGLRTPPTPEAPRTEFPQLTAPKPQVPYRPESLGDVSGPVREGELPTALTWTPEMVAEQARRTPEAPPPAAVREEATGTVGDEGRIGARGTEGTRFAPKALLPAPRPEGPVGVLPTLSGPVMNTMWGIPETSRATPSWAVPEEEILGPWGGGGQEPARAGVLGSAEPRPQYTYKPSEKAATLSEPRKEYGREFDQAEFQEEIDRNNRILRDPRATEEDKTVARDRLRDAQEGLDRVRQGGKVVPQVTQATASESPNYTVEKDNSGITWAKAPGKTPISLSKRQAEMPKADLDKYVADKFAEQGEGHSAIQERAGTEAEPLSEEDKAAKQAAEERKKGILPGMGKAVAEQQAGAAKVKGEELTAQANAPRSIEAAAGEMETKSPLFRGTAASPQNEMFTPAKPSAEQPEWMKILSEHEQRQAEEAKRPVTPDEEEQARALMQNSAEILESSDKPGRYFDETTQADVYNPRYAPAGGRLGGSWRGVKSGKGMLGWLRDTPITATQLRRALRMGQNSIQYQNLLRTAVNWLRGREGGTYLKPLGREPGEE
jgi:hypothetical protein